MVYGQHANHGQKLLGHASILTTHTSWREILEICPRGNNKMVIIVFPYL